jgi:GNAT superfamily N-acetyltransferase
MIFQIRQATTGDATAIARLIEQRLGESVPPSQIADAMSFHMTYVATVNNRVVGFVDGFTTESADNLSRLELDLIAVDADSAGQGTGKALLQHITQKAQDAAWYLSRALVAIDNVPMHRATGSFGYHRQEDVCGLFVSYSQMKNNQIDNSGSENIHIIPVQTLTYTGVWLEGDISKKAILAAKNAQTEKNLMLTGIVQPLSNTSACNLLTEYGFINVGNYQWWQKKL